MNDVYEKWQRWRNEDHEDNAVLSRHEVITLLTEIERLRAVHRAGAKVEHIEPENSVYEKWQRWRKNADHEDNVVLFRHEIITLLTESERLRDEIERLRDLLSWNHIDPDAVIESSRGAAARRALEGGE